MLSLTVKLPHEPFAISIAVCNCVILAHIYDLANTNQVSIHETFSDIRQSILDLPSTVQYTCFSLWFENSKLNDFLELSSVERIYDGATLELREEPYTDREARAHVLKVRDIIGLVSTKNSLITGLSSGVSALNSVEKDGQATEGPHPMTGFDLSSPPILTSIVPHADKASTQCVKSLGLSHWNPPPPDLHLRGHLLYLYVLTLEGGVHHITADISGFYTSNSTNQKFDPTPRTGSGKAYHAHSLLVLLQKLSPMFGDQLKATQVALGERDPMTVFAPTNALLAFPWLSHPAPPPQPDISKSQEQFLLGGSDNLDTIRDWNEDLQSTREMPKESIQDRILRERLLNKLYFDFTEAAAKGAILIARDEIPALNPTETTDARIYLYNGIFFSYGADGIGTFANEGGDAAARYAVGKDLAGVRLVNGLDVDGICPLCTVIIDYCGRRIVAQSPVPGIFRQREDGSNQIVYGGVDSHDVVANDPAFGKIFTRIAEQLHVKPHLVWDKEGAPHELALSVETKGLEGTDGRKYILDLYRITPLDVEFLAKNGKIYPHKMPVLRPEAVEDWWKDKVKTWVTQESDRLKSEGKEGRIVFKSVTEPDTPAVATADEVVDGTPAEPAEEKSNDEKLQTEDIVISGLKFGINLDVFAGQLPATEKDKVEYAEDEVAVRELSGHVTTSLIPMLLADLRTGALSIPLDSSQLTKTLHKRGINMRYLGALVSAIDDQKDLGRLDVFKISLVQEIMLRSLKHVANSLLVRLPVAIVPYAAAHIFNCVLGTKLNAAPSVTIDPVLIKLYGGASPDFGFVGMTPAAIQKRVQEEAEKRFAYALADDWVSQVRHVQLFRELSIVLGFQWRSKAYVFEKVETEEIVAVPEPKPNTGKNGRRSRKAVHQTSPAVPVSPVAKTTFVAEDLLNVNPVIKGSAMKSRLSEEALEAGRVSIMQGQKDVGIELLLESLSLHEQVYGVIHPEVARAYSQLSMIYSGLEDKPAAADFAHKAVVIAERTIGLDSSETILMYLNLALCEHANGHPRLALAYVRRAFGLWRVVCGPGHPDEVTTMNNTAVMLQSLQEYHDSRQWFESSLTLCESIFGAASVNAATLYFQLAQALVLTQDSAGAVKRMRDAYKVFNDKLGPDDKATKEAEVWLEQLTTSAVHHARQAKDMQAKKARKLAATGVVGGAKPVGGQQAKTTDTRSIEELVKFIGN
ncbi:clustered mitochondria-domain-containing protein [Lipomyces arxii]|uniref:clustered mitochondria-domain-containing protein n=1 Tax=Lipomyces arxii TaxID=56418 RepID=UPI0034CE36AF